MDIDPIRPSTLNDLAATEQAHCLSLFMPTHATGSDSRQDPIRLGNLLDQLHEQLKAEGMRRPDIEALLKPARDEVKQSSFWQHQGAGLAIFLADGVSHFLRLPETVDESVTIGPHFNVKPLLGALASSEPFYVLALTKEQAHFYRGTRRDFEQVQNAGFPLSADEVVGVREPQQELQHHSGVAPHRARGDRGHRGDTGQADFHGHGEGETKLKADTLHYLKTVADRVGDYLYGLDAPLVLAADVSLAGLYRQEHTQGRLIETGHVDSPANLPASELRQRAWKLAAPALEADLSSLLNRFGDAASAGKAAQGVAEVASAAAQGKVDTLFFDPRATQLGWLDNGGSEAHLIQPPGVGEGHENQAEDLVNRAVIDTLRSSGRAVPLTASSGKDDRQDSPAPPKAILRY